MKTIVSTILPTVVWTWCLHHTTVIIWKISGYYAKVLKSPIVIYWFLTQYWAPALRKYVNFPHVRIAGSKLRFRFLILEAHWARFQSKSSIHGVSVLVVETLLNALFSQCNLMVDSVVWRWNQTAVAMIEVKYELNEYCSKLIKNVFQIGNLKNQL